MRDPAVAAAIAAGRVPEDISAAYLDETRDQAAIAAIIFVGVLTCLVVAARTVSRSCFFHHYGLDDGLALFSLVLLIPFIALSIILIKMGSGRHYAYIQYVMSLDTVEETEVLDFAAHLIYTSCLLVCRCSGLAFYHRICNLHDKFLIAIKTTAGILVAGYLPQMFLIIFHCFPVTGLWPYDWQPGVDDYKCLTWGIVYSVNSSVSLFCDMLVFGIPIAMLRILDMPPKRKVQLACILLPGTLVVGISISRLVLVILGQWEPDESWSYDPMLTVEVSEIGATLIALSVPGLKPLFDKFVLRRGPPTASGDDSGLQTVGGSRSRGNTLRNRNLRTGHSILASNDNLRGAANMHYELETGLKDDSRSPSTEGILVNVDSKLREEQDLKEYIRRQYGGT